ncbi:MAG: hypothetical protein IJT38_03550 [Clostridia bacterium]|nr:hypothetical protein [Clostridia bacterium]
MKKVLLLTLALLFVCCGCGKKGGDAQTPSDNNIQDSTVSEPIITSDVKLGDYTGRFIEKYVASGTYYIKERLLNDDTAEETELALSGTKASMRTADTNQIVDGDKLYLVMHEQKAVLTSPVAETMKESMIKSLGIKTAKEAKDNFVSSGSEAVNGTEYSYEEYKNGDETLKYYFDTETIRYIKHISGNGDESLYEILQISKTIPADMFDIPDGYVIQDLSSLK